MADLSEYIIFEGVEFREEVKTLMQIFADSWDECRAEDCSRCKYRHGKEQYTFLACISERYAEKLIAADVARVRHGRWLNFYGDFSTAECDICAEIYEVSPDESPRKEFFDAFKEFYKFCQNCGAKMDGGGCRETD